MSQTEERSQFVFESLFSRFREELEKESVNDEVSDGDLSTIGGFIGFLESSMNEVQGVQLQQWERTVNTFIHDEETKSKLAENHLDISLACLEEKAVRLSFPSFPSFPSFLFSHFSPFPSLFPPTFLSSCSQLMILLWTPSFPCFPELFQHTNELPLRCLEAPIGDVLVQAFLL
jgi:hypothetical protein